MPRPPDMELLAPAGNMEKLKIAIHFGADAVYLGGTAFSLRSAGENFTPETMATAIGYAHQRQARVYIACNTFPRPEETGPLIDYLRFLDALAPDAIIIADPGVLALARRHAPSIPLHISTQANTTHPAAARFWKDQGAVRVNTAREMTLAGIADMARQVNIEIESFVHGAMCIAYSGRCLLSAAMTGRSANSGSCAHPCRWQYALVEALRPGAYLPIAEDSHGTYVFNSRDLCMIDHLPAMIDAGVHSFKIEGRMKSIHYLATVVNVYRQALDRCMTAPDRYRVADHWRSELASVNHRGYGTGFYLNRATDIQPNPAPPAQMDTRRFVADVTHTHADGTVSVRVRNKLCTGDSVEILRPGRSPQTAVVSSMLDADALPVVVVQPGATARLTLGVTTAPMDVIRRSAPA